MNALQSRYIYLHGLASSPSSTKARFFGQCFARHGIELEMPDLNQGDFARLTLSRQCQQVQQLIDQSQEDVILLGSSLGGLTAALLVEQCLQIKVVILLAPALDFLETWQALLLDAALEDWRTQGVRRIFHYGFQKEMELEYQFIQDLNSRPELLIMRQIPILIFHGIHDDVIPYQTVQKFIRCHPWCSLYGLNSDHALTDQLPLIWSLIQDKGMVPKDSLE